VEFPRTRWTLILACRDQPELQRRALAELLPSYWLPLCQTLRLRGHSAEISDGCSWDSRSCWLARQPQEALEQVVGSGAARCTIG
jgi:hypothetical protein